MTLWILAAAAVSLSVGCWAGIRFAEARDADITARLVWPVDNEVAR
jgi:hypothetical protein